MLSTGRSCNWTQNSEWVKETSLIGTFATTLWHTTKLRSYAHGPLCMTLSTSTSSLKSNKTLFSISRKLNPLLARQIGLKVLTMASMLIFRLVRNFAAMVPPCDLQLEETGMFRDSGPDCEKDSHLPVISSITYKSNL